MQVGKVRRRVAALLAAPVVAAALGYPALAAPAAPDADGTGTRWLLDDLGRSGEISPGSLGGDLLAQVPVLPAPALPVPLDPRMVLPGRSGDAPLPPILGLPDFPPQQQVETDGGVICRASVTLPAFMDLVPRIGINHEVKCTKDGEPYRPTG